VDALGLTFGDGITVKIASLVFSEIRHRKLNSLLLLVAVAVAVGSSVGVMTLLRAYQVRTVRRVAALDDEVRKIMKNMGFNITILPQDQNLLDFHASDFAEKTMPIQYVDRLANSPDIVTINHLRPALIRKIEWPERNRQILLMGVSGIVPFKHRDNKRPLTQPVPQGTMDVGSVLAVELSLEQDDEVILRGRKFRVGKVNPQRGTKDDITVWIDLKEAQQMLDMPDKINLIQALECNCASIDRLAEIQAEISALLGDEVQVIELSTTAIARAKAREGVKVEGQAAIDRLERLAAVLLPLVVVGAGVIVSLLTAVNVRDRRAEIGILRALGVRSRQIMRLFVSKAAVLGCAGALAGYAIGFLGVAGAETGGSAGGVTASDLYGSGLLLSVLLLTPVVAVLAAWLPAVAATHQDPAVVLREE